jgi:aryl-alcohol dehydrogenase-like predicted oxidoreductase
MSLSYATASRLLPSTASACCSRPSMQGVTLFDTAALYGFGANETLVGRVLQGASQPHRAGQQGRHGGRGPVAGDGKLSRVIDGRPEAIRRELRGQPAPPGHRRRSTSYYLHRWDKDVPHRGQRGRAVAPGASAGKVRAHRPERGVGRRRFARPTPCTPSPRLQTEYSLWTRNPEIAVLDACREIGAAFVAFSPVAPWLSRAASCST